MVSQLSPCGEVADELTEVEWHPPPPVISVTLFGVPVILLLLIAGIWRGDAGMLWASSLLAAMYALLVFLNRGYQAFWSTNAIYLREPGLTWLWRRKPMQCIRIEDIEAVFGQFRSGQPLARSMLVFDTVVFRSQSSAVEPLTISLFFTKHASMIEMLEYVRSQRPSVMSEDVLHYMRTGSLNAPRRVSFVTTRQER